MSSLVKIKLLAKIGTLTMIHNIPSNRTFKSRILARVYCLKILCLLELK